MAHEHPVIDQDKHYVIDPITRKITSLTPEKNTLVQYDHNSERFTFEIDRYVDGHDMSLCNKIQIHYINISSNRNGTSSDVYEVNDMYVDEKEEKVIFSWLIGINATRYSGTLNFAIRFACLTDDVIDYDWHTNIFAGITISNGINNGPIIIEDYLDILENWRISVEENAVGNKMDKENPTGTGSFSMNRLKGSTVGDYSHTEGMNCVASGMFSHAEGGGTGNYDPRDEWYWETGSTASGDYSHSEGYITIASGSASHAEGSETKAEATDSHAEGKYTKASGEHSHAEGKYTIAGGDSSHSEGYESEASGIASHTEGYNSVASNFYSHAEGNNTTASGHTSHAEGLYTIASSDNQHVQGKYNVEDAANEYAHIVGGGSSITDRKNIYTLDWSGNAVYAGDVTNGNGVSMDSLKAAEEANATAIGSIYDETTTYMDTKISELINGAPTTLDTLGEIADAMATNQTVVEALDAAIGSKADSDHTHSNYATKANPVLTGTLSHNGSATGTNAAVIGKSDNSTNADYSVVIGGYNNNIQKSHYSGPSSGYTKGAAIIGGHDNSISGESNTSYQATNGSVILGGSSNTIFKSNNAGVICSDHSTANDGLVLGGAHSTSDGSFSVAAGFFITALTNQLAIGHYNNTSSATDNSTTGTSTGSAFVVGNGTSSSRSNAFRVNGKGQTYATSTSISSGADYAEYFEWADGNPDSEDRVGYFVTLDENNPEQIRIANKDDDYILGIISGMPSIIGNGDETWRKRYVTDNFGRYMEEEFEYEETLEEYTDEKKSKAGKKKKGTKWKENPDYDKTRLYISRDQRAEWSAVGMLGVLSVYDDGTCVVNGYCECSNNGIGTASNKNKGYRVIKRVADNIVKVIFR